MHLIKVYADDGKEFKGTNYNDLFNEVNDYEAALRLKKEAEDAEKKARLEKEERLLERINSIAKCFNSAVEDFQKENGHICKYFENDKLKVQKYEYSGATIIKGVLDGGYFRF